jgi:hypothetical protein
VGVGGRREGRLLNLFREKLEQLIDLSLSTGGVCESSASIRVQLGSALPTVSKEGLGDSGEIDEKAG